MARAVAFKFVLILADEVRLDTWKPVAVRVKGQLLSRRSLRNAQLPCPVPDPEVRVQEPDLPALPFSAGWAERRRVHSPPAQTANRIASPVLNSVGDVLIARGMIGLNPRLARSSRYLRSISPLALLSANINVPLATIGRRELRIPKKLRQVKRRAVSALSAF